MLASYLLHKSTFTWALLYLQTMPPNVDPTPSGVVFESDTQTSDLGLDKDVSVLKNAAPRKHEYVWFNIFWFLYLHIASLYGIYLAFTSAKWQTNVFGEYFPPNINTQKLKHFKDDSLTHYRKHCLSEWTSNLLPAGVRNLFS